MLCHQCRRVAVVAVRQLASSSRAQSTIVRTVLTSGPTTQYKRSLFPTPIRYSTSSEAQAPSPSIAGVPEKPDYLNTAESEIWDKLTSEFSPSELVVQDISGGCGSMYGIEIASEKFRGTNMLKQQRMVNSVLGDQLKSWHGVQLRTKVPS
ncbi:bola protein [Truncatella angustata]|uniref:Bola protein n=1 Tax=Truncatella angustata TaxID=152316 RepID=A0A9P8ULQ2_9PEZI|nr:bola protein [Truncatella angustata]KAH6654880.1 bola protein [Truncatella angustata]